MRIKLDENLPAGLEPLLAALGHDVDTVPAEGIGGQDDDVVWRAAQADGRFLVTQDLDFSDARKYAPGTHHGLLLVRLPEPGRIALQDRVTSLFRTEAVDTWSGCMVTATPTKGAGQKARLRILGAKSLQAGRPCRVVRTRCCPTPTLRCSLSTRQ